MPAWEITILIVLVVAVVVAIVALLGHGIHLDIHDRRSRFAARRRARSRRRSTARGGHAGHA